jgi:nitrite reductase (NADH) large subunit
MTTYVIIGGGVAGVTAARTLAGQVSERGSGHEIHILSAEPYLYYPRPLLWRFIAGTMEREDLIFQPLSWYEDRGIQFHLGTDVTALDGGAHRLMLGNGSDMAYDQLLLATGARPFVPPVEGADKEGVFTLRTLEDAMAIKAYVEGGAAGMETRPTSKAVVIGGGLLGLETARALHSAGPSVHVIEIADYLLPRQLDQEGAQVLRALLEDQGLEITTGSIVEAILGDEHADGVCTEEGRVIEGELILFSAGIRCRARLAQKAGLEVNRGAVVDKRMKTSVEGIFAAGDVAELEGDVGGTIPPAMDQAEVAAANMVEPGSEIYSGTMPTTTLEVAGARVTSLGAYNAAEDEVDHIVRYTDLERGLYRKFVLQDDRVVGAILLNDPPRAGLARQLIDREVDVSEHRDRLVHDDFDLKSLL